MVVLVICGDVSSTPTALPKEEFWFGIVIVKGVGHFRKKMFLFFSTRLLAERCERKKEDIYIYVHTQVK